MNTTMRSSFRVMYAKPRRERESRRAPAPLRRGLTLVEVLIASVILSIAALAALDLLAATDAASLAARRMALASIEAERALINATAAVHDGREPETRHSLDALVVGEALASCTVEVSAIRELCSVPTGDGTSKRIPVIRLTAEVTDPRGATIATLERLAAVPDEGGQR